MDAEKESEITVAASTKTLSLATLVSGVLRVATFENEKMPPRCENNTNLRVSKIGGEVYLFKFYVIRRLTARCRTGSPLHASASSNFISALFKFVVFDRCFTSQCAIVLDIYPRESASTRRSDFPLVLAGKCSRRPQSLPAEAAEVLHGRAELPSGNGQRQPERAAEAVEAAEAVGVPHAPVHHVAERHLRSFPSGHLRNEGEGRLV